MVIPIMSPLSPTHRYQDSGEAASIARRRSTSAGSTEFRYAASWRSNSSKLGMLTTLTACPLLLQDWLGAGGQMQFRTGGDKDDVGLAARGLAQHVRAARQSAGRRHPGAIQGRNLLPAERHQHRPVTMLHRHPPRLRRFVGVAGPDYGQMGHRAQRRQMLHRLMRGTVFPKPNRVVGKDVDHVQFHQGGQPNRAARVVAEYQERGTQRHQSTVQRDPIEYGTHGVLADAEVQIAAGEPVAARNRHRP